MEWIAPEYAQKPEKGPPERAIALNSCYGIFRACGVETAILREAGGYDYLVKLYEKNQNLF